MQNVKYSNLQPRDYADKDFSTQELQRLATQYALRSKAPVADIVNKEAPSAIPLRPSFDQWKRNNIAEPLRWYVAVDALGLMLGFLAALWFASALNSHFYNRPLINPAKSDELLRILQYFLVAGCVLFNFERKGHYRLRKPFWLEAQNIFSTLGIAMAIDGFMQFAWKQDFSRISLILGWAFAAFAIVIGREAYRSILRKQNRWQVSTLLVGSGSTAEDACAAIKSERNLGYVITSQIDSLPLAYQEAGRSWERLCARHKADYVVIALDGPDLADAEEPIAQLMREEVPFSVSPPMRNMPVLGMVPQYFFNHDVMLMTHHQGLEQPLPRVVKRAFDVIASSLILIVGSPLLALIALAVKSDGGDAMFAHKRIGLGGRTFRCLKFRSMVVNGNKALQEYLANNPDAQDEWEQNCKLVEDPRVTLIGKFLRRYSLDELPQLLNVLRGDMSLVGPRPIAVAEAPRYSKDIAYYYRVRPGITGLWQVSGRNNVTYDKRVQMDVWYVRNWSLWHDIAILCKTLPALINPKGAY